ncbi:MAG TPA: hypothetical protein VLT85_04965 [Terriglobales bacterium]|nr:hypothetical protein [Terriglobales bacterium]
MDPVSFSLLVKALEPALGLLALATIPLGIIWLRTSYKLRMREMDLEEKAVPLRLEARLAAIEGRLASMERALGAPALPERNPLEERAAMLEGPATGAAEPPPRARER